MLGLLYRF